MTTPIRKIERGLNRFSSMQFIPHHYHDVSDYVNHDTTIDEVVKEDSCPAV